MGENIVTSDWNQTFSLTASWKYQSLQGMCIFRQASYLKYNFGTSWKSVKFPPEGNNSGFEKLQGLFKEWYFNSEDSIYRNLKSFDFTFRYMRTTLCIMIHSTHFNFSSLLNFQPLILEPPIPRLNAVLQFSQPLQADLYHFKVLYISTFS